MINMQVPFPTNVVIRASELITVNPLIFGNIVRSYTYISDIKNSLMRSFVNKI